MKDVTETELIGGVEQRDLFLLDHDPAWADTYALHESRIRDALGRVAIAVEHIGSTSVPGLAAKPIIDILVTVPDVTAEDDYLTPLIGAGYVLRDRLRADAADRQLYEETKRALVKREWSDANAYADAKTGVIEAIKARARVTLS